MGIATHTVVLVGHDLLVPFPQEAASFGPGGVGEKRRLDRVRAFDGCFEIIETAVGHLPHRFPCRRLYSDISVQLLSPGWGVAP